jgi:glycosyltransferase involved in cell wall biosynthesis
VFVVRQPGRGLGGGLRATLRRRVEGHVLARADRVCALSRFMAGRIAALHGLAPGAVCVVPGGVDRERFTPVADRRSLRRRLGLPEGAPVLFCLRNLEPRMGVDVLLEAMPAILARHGDTVLVVGGVGPLAASLHARAQALRLGPAVRFAGFVPETELAAFYAAADAFVLPSQRLEGFGLVTLESLACGTPVVATRVGATPELLEPVDPALLVETPTAAGLARAVVALLARSDREALGARCRAHTAAYTWACVAARLEGVLTGAGGA